MTDTDASAEARAFLAQSEGRTPITWQAAAKNTDKACAIIRALLAAKETAEAEAAALREKLEVAVDGLTDIASKISWEINPSNYDHVEVRDMNSDWCEIGNIADATLATIDQPKEGDEDE